MCKVSLGIFFFNESFHCCEYFPERDEKNKNDEFFTSIFILKKFTRHIETDHKWNCVVNTNQGLKCLKFPKTQITLDSLNLPDNF